MASCRPRYMYDILVTTPAAVQPRWRIDELGCGGRDHDVGTAEAVSRGVQGADSSVVQRSGPYRFHLFGRIRVDRVVHKPDESPDVGMAAHRACFRAIQYVRMVDPQVRHASTGRRIRAASDLRSPYQTASSVFHEERNDGRLEAG